MLCSACQSIVKGKAQKLSQTSLVGSFALYSHHSPPSQLEQAAKDGCQICVVIWEQLGTTEQESVRKTARDSSIISRSLTLKRYTGRSKGYYGWFTTFEQEVPVITFQFGDLGYKTVRFVLLTGCDPNLGSVRFMLDGTSVVTCIDDLVHKEQINSDQMDNPEFAYDWHGTQCTPTDNHLLCFQNVHPVTPDFPTRVIDLGTTMDDGDIRLSLPGDQRDPLPYATLSYHWGPNPEVGKMLLLRKDVLDIFANGIPWDLLPQLFAHTIGVLRRLGYRYVWIDAFCILQDDEEDFIKESAVMGEIYRHAMLNIAAGGASSATESLFGPRNPAFVNACIEDFDIPVDAEQVKAFENAPKRIQGKYYVFEDKFAVSNMLESPLNRRAWVFQERQLSPRILHFGKHQMFWQCRQARACETFPKGVPTTKPFAMPGGVEMLDFDPAITSQPQFGVQQWFDVVEMYSACSLTFENDKLLALSGLSRRFSETAFTDDQYLCGLWKSCLIPSLLWRVKDGKQARKHDGSEPTCARFTTATVFPSWSWASLHGKVVLAVNVQRTPWLSALVEVLETKSELAVLANPFGNVLSASLKLRCRLLSDKGIHWMKQLWEMKDDMGGAFYHGAYYKYAHLEDSLLIWCFFDDAKTEFDPLKKKHLFLSGAVTSTNLFLLPLTYFHEDPDSPLIQGLAIVPVSNSSIKSTTSTPTTPEQPLPLQHYRRIGYFEARSSAKGSQRLINGEIQNIVLV